MCAQVQGVDLGGGNVRREHMSPPQEVHGRASPLKQAARQGPSRVRLTHLRGCAGRGVVWRCGAGRQMCPRWLKYCRRVGVTALGDSVVAGVASVAVVAERWAWRAGNRWEAGNVGGVVSACTASRGIVALAQLWHSGTEATLATPTGQTGNSACGAHCTDAAHLSEAFWSTAVD